MWLKSVFLVACQWSRPCEAVGGPRVDSPSPIFPSLCKAGALPNSPANHSSQPGGAAAESGRKKKNNNTKNKKFKSTQGRREGERREKTPWKLSSLRARKSDTILSDCRVVRGRSSVPWAEEKGRGHVSRMLKLLWDFMSADECSEVRAFDFSFCFFLLELFFCFWRLILKCAFLRSLVSCTAF